MSFREDVIAGLSAPQKSIPPKYFYDAAGSRLFERICRLPEYYLTRAELALTRKNVASIARFAAAGARGRSGVQLVEYGSGESLKTRLLIRALRPAAYVPVDISESALRAAARRLGREFPWLQILPLAADFSRPVEIPGVRPYGQRVAYFPGSTIGNLTPEQAHAFLRVSRGQAARMLVGVDVRKDANMLHEAYNDAQGVTAAFNLNLLKRINQELRGNFDPRKFAHYAFYDPEAGRVEMHLVALERHAVRIGAHRFEFDAGESIHTENSYKYSLQGFRALARAAGFEAKKLWTDRRGLFALHGLEA